MTRPLLAAALLLAACNTGFEPQYRVRDVRVLAVRSSVTAGNPFPSADVAPGETLVLEALVANPLARPGVAVTWYGCLPQPTQALPPCDDITYLQDPGRLATAPGVTLLGTGATVSLVVPPLTEALTFVVQLAQAEPTLRCRLYAEMGVVVVAEGGGRRSTATKKVRVRPPTALIPDPDLDRYVLNLNPRIGAVQRAPVDRDACAGGVPIASGPFPAGQTVICGNPVSGSSQHFTFCEPNGVDVSTVSEELDWQWFVTEGEFPEEEGGVGNAEGSDVELARAPGPFTLWTVLRDGRGGTDWVSFAVSAL